MCDMKEKIYKVKLIVIDEETGKEAEGETYSHFIDDLDGKHEVSALREIYKQLLQEIEKGE